MARTPSRDQPQGDTDSARAFAVQQLGRVEQEGAYVSLARGDTDAPDPRTERQATEYVAGVTRWRRRLDFVLRHFYRGDYDAMEPVLKQILRVGLYDVLFLDTPPHAAVNEAVVLAKRMVRPGAGGLVNGILRAVLRQKDRLPVPETGDAAEDLAVAHSHPTWLVRRWLARFGQTDAEALLAWNNERPVFGLRINTLRTSVDAFHAALDDAGVAWEPSAYLDDFVRVRRLQPVLHAGWLDDGRCAVQDESAGLVVRLLDPHPGETLLDACAAPGGKALYAAGRMQNQGSVLACDVHPGRLSLLRRAAPEHGVTIIKAAAADLREMARRPDRPVVDRVLLDAPCSGLGVLAKRADLRWHRAAEAIEELTALQDDLLDAAATFVRPGGLLVYSTCTITQEENEDRIAAFLARHPAFSLETAQGHVPDALVSDEGYLVTLPHRHGIDGAFAGLLRKAAE